MLAGAEEFRDASRGVELYTMALAVVEGEGVAIVTVAAGDAEAGGGIEAAAQQADGIFHESHFFTGNFMGNPILSGCASDMIVRSYHNQTTSVRSRKQQQEGNDTARRPAGPINDRGAKD